MYGYDFPSRKRPGETVKPRYSTLAEAKMARSINVEHGHACTPIRLYSAELN